VLVERRIDPYHDGIGVACEGSAAESCFTLTIHCIHVRSAVDQLLHCQSLALVRSPVANRRSKPEAKVSVVGRTEERCLAL